MTFSQRMVLPERSSLAWIGIGIAFLSIGVSPIEIDKLKEIQL